ncbi:MAG: hypothetical protein LQ352_003294 [Teloschistes flavicans]|nr:MAG: hypothetical protein LQ352_003294 [Teloschistes flavicans]
MPADYNSTAQALALPVSPPDSPTLNHQYPRWNRRRGSNSLSLNQSHLAQPDSSLTGRIFRKVERFGRDVQKRFTPLQLALASVAGFVAIILTILFFIFNDKFFAWLEPRAVKWKNLKGGWCFVHRLVANDKRFQAFSSVLKHDGVKLLIMIRLCPLPYSLSNGAISTFPTVTPQVFALATAVASLKLVIPIFIGTRLAAIAKSGGRMDASTKAINWISIIGGFLLGTVTGWLIYQRTKARARQLESEERSGSQHSQSRSTEYSDGADENTATATVLRDDQIDFRDDDDTHDYRDEYTDDEDNVFKHGDGDEEEAIGLDKRPPRKG